jgi:hypothetical protein
MTDQARAVMFGAVCAIVLVPIIGAAWRRLSPPPAPAARTLKRESWHQYEKIEYQAGMAGFCGLIILVAVIGNAELPSNLLLGLTLGVFFLGYLMWTLVASAMRGTEGIGDLRQFVEAKYRISFSSWLAVLVLGSAVGAISVVILMVLLQRGG